jgi:hypothetical protein
MRWENLQQFWSRTDIIIREIIAHTKKAPTTQANLRSDGNMMDEIREGWNSLSDLPAKAHNCLNQYCHEDETRMLEIIGRNVRNIFRTWQDGAPPSHDADQSHGSLSSNVGLITNQASIDIDSDSQQCSTELMDNLGSSSTAAPVSEPVIPPMSPASSPPACPVTKPMGSLGSSSVATPVSRTVIPPMNPASSPVTNPVTKLTCSQECSSTAAPVIKLGSQTVAAWQELTRDSDGKIKLMEVRNFGMQKTTRKLKRRKRKKHA